MTEVSNKYKDLIFQSYLNTFRPQDRQAEQELMVLVQTMPQFINDCIKCSDDLIEKFIGEEVQGQTIGTKDVVLSSLISGFCKGFVAGTITVTAIAEQEIKEEVDIGKELELTIKEIKRINDLMRSIIEKDDN